MRRDIFSSSVSDARTRATIQEAWKQHKLLLEPHGAVAWRGFLDWQKTESLEDLPAAVLETAHPAKFPEEIEKTLGFSPEAPSSIAAVEKLPENYDHMNADYDKIGRTMNFPGLVHLPAVNRHEPREVARMSDVHCVGQ